MINGSLTPQKYLNSDHKGKKSFYLNEKSANLSKYMIYFMLQRIFLPVASLVENTLSCQEESLFSLRTSPVTLVCYMKYISNTFIKQPIKSVT